MHKNDNCMNMSLESQFLFIIIIIIFTLIP